MPRGHSTPVGHVTRRRFLALSGGSLAALSLATAEHAAGSARSASPESMDPGGLTTAQDQAFAHQDLEDTAAATRLPTVAFTWDGPFRSMYLNALPLFQARHIRATAFVISGVIPGSSPDVNTDPKCTWGQISDLRSSGWEVSNHTYDHKCLIYLRPAEMRAEIQNGKKILVDRGYATPGFAYPYNRFDKRSQSLVAEYHEYGRAGGNYALGQITDVETLYGLPSINLAHLTTEEMVDRTKTECLDGRLDLIWLCHCCGDVGWDGEDQRLTVDPKELAGYLDWLFERRDARKVAVATCRVLIRGNLLGS